MKTAVILFNLGGPDSKESIKPFLFNFFTDKNIIPLPYPLRWLVAKSISRRRSQREAGTSYGLLGNKSPLLENTEAQAAALEAKLGAGFKVFTCMRYWHPMAPGVARLVKSYAPDKIILLPLYPQFSTTTTWSSKQAWDKAAREIHLDKPAAMICCYPLDDGFITASAEHIRAELIRAARNGHDPRVLFSAHGLPEDVIRSGDPYQWQCEETAKTIAARLGLTDWAICYQSRVGPKKWIGPSLDEELERAAHDHKPVLIYPHAFTQEHVETLVELDIEYRHKADALNLPGYYRAATVSTHDAFIAGLADMVRAHMNQTGVSADGDARLCPDNFPRCCMQTLKQRNAA